MPVGCFKDELSARALPEMLANFRIKSAKWPEVLNWTDLEGTVVKKCAAKVRLSVYQLLEIQDNVADAPNVGLVKMTDVVIGKCGWKMEKVEML